MFGIELLNFFAEGFAQNGTKKAETAINDVDRHALLKQVDLDVEALHDWRDGILTIGTLGFEALKLPTEPKEYLVLESEEEEDDEEEEEEEKSFVHEEDEDIIDYFEDEELNPLMLTAFRHKGKDVSGEKERDLILRGYEFESKYSRIIEIENEDKKKGGERRITLADLFLADASEVGMRLKNGDQKVMHKKTADVRSKSSLSFAKKLIPRVKEDSHPIKNFQRVSTMLSFFPSSFFCFKT